MPARQRRGRAGGFAARHPHSEVFFASKARSNLWFLIAFLDASGHALEMMNDYTARPGAGTLAVTRAGEVVAIRRHKSAADLCAFDLTPGFET